MMEPLNSDGQKLLDFLIALMASLNTDYMTRFENVHVYYYDNTHVLLLMIIIWSAEGA